MFGPSGRIAASPSAFFHQSEYAAASAKNWSTLAWLTPGLPLRSVSAPEAGNDVVDDRLGGLVVGGVGGHDAVAVEGLGREGLGRRGRFLDGNLRRFRLAQDLPGEGGDQLAFGRGIVDRRHAERGRAFEQVVRVLEQAARPFDRRDQFRRADAAVLVGVNQGQGRLVELQPRGGAGERDPELEVELIEGHEVGARLKLHLVKAARAEETPLLGGRS